MEIRRFYNSKATVMIYYWIEIKIKIKLKLNMIILAHIYYKILFLYYRMMLQKSHDQQLFWFNNKIKK